ncbi:GT2 family glycosyltransferase [Algoriphagus iocasae]|uniref:GT2 family glycosyltransferase n=1 Tax=Algoriphagus iocasae TaxID=1836499 RepID=A0A841MZD8_9BACT|nr:glycosyltransferase [Algoriphagus iocasae]MBB6327825.1 GT2 family glycosyltransferase [Algoriphagus iocasae]
MPSVTAIIVTYNRLNILKQNLTCVLGQNIVPNNVIIVDNGSNDGTVEFLESLKLENVSNIFLQNNIGFGGGLAEGMNKAIVDFDPDYFWLLDDDSFPENDLLEYLLNQSQIIGMDGVFGLSGYIHSNGIPKRPNKGVTNFTEVDFVLVDNALISKNVVKKAGVVSGEFFMMCEDYEFSLRARENGFPVFLLFPSEPLVKRMHLGSQSSSRTLIWRGYYHTRNHILILKKYYSTKKLLGYINRHSKIILHALIFGPYRFEKVKFRLLGIKDGLLDVKGKTLDPKRFN